LDWVYDDGGREAAGFKGDADDCTVRAIAIATGLPYHAVYLDLTRRMKMRARRKGKPTVGVKVSPRNGVPIEVSKEFMAERGWQWVPTMSIGSGTTVHLREDELPDGRVIARVSKHVCAVIDGVVRDTFDPSRDGQRAVYGYWVPDDRGGRPVPGAEEERMSEKRVRISRRFLLYLSGTGAWNKREDDPELYDVLVKVKAAPEAKDHSTTLPLDDAERAVLYHYADYFANACGDAAGPDDMDSLADLNAARAAMRQLERLA
jgi:hypothetical protein